MQQEIEGKQSSCNTDNTFMAIVLMVIGSSLFGTGFIYVSEHKIHPISTGLLRGLANIFVSYFLALKQGIDLTFNSSFNFKWQAIRNIIMIVSGLGYTWSLFFLPLPVALTIQSTSPIFTTFFDRVINKTRLNRRQEFWLSIAFLGVVLTANGGYLMYLVTANIQENTSKFQNYMSRDPLAAMFAAFILTIIMCLHGYAVLLTKKLVNTHSFQVLYFSGLLILLSSALLYPYASVDPTFDEITMPDFFTGLLLTGLPVTLGGLFMIKALLTTKNYGVLTPFMFCSILVGYIISVVRYDEDINIICLVGAIAIMTGIIFVARCEEDRIAN